MKFKYLLESKQDLTKLLSSNDIHKISKIMNDCLYLDFNNSEIFEEDVSKLKPNKIESNEVIVLHSPKTSFVCKGETFFTEPETWIVFKDIDEDDNVSLFVEEIETHIKEYKMFKEKPKFLFDRAKIEKYLCFRIKSKSNYNLKDTRKERLKNNDKMGSRIRDYLRDKNYEI